MAPTNDWVNNTLVGIDRDIAKHREQIENLLDARRTITSLTGQQRPVANVMHTIPGARKGGRPAGSKLTPAGRKALSVAMKARWAAKKAAAVAKLAPPAPPVSQEALHTAVRSAARQHGTRLVNTKKKARHHNAPPATAPAADTTVTT